MSTMQRIPNDPQYLKRATDLAHAWNTDPLAWCLQDDGSLTVVFMSGQKVNSSHLPPPPTTRVLTSDPPTVRNLHVPPSLLPSSPAPGALRTVRPHRPNTASKRKPRAKPS